MTNFSRSFLAGLGASLLLTVTTAAYAQVPANDLCSTAVSLTSGASVTGTTIGATDDLIGLPGCQSAASQVHPDVWYTIVPTGSATQLGVVVTPAPGNLGARYEIQIFGGTCGAGLLLLGYNCGTGTVAAGAGSLVPGTTYRIAVSSPDSASASAFTIQATATVPAILPSQDCNNATILTNSTTFSQGTINSGSGVNSTEVSPNNSCWGSGGERQSKWFKFIAGTTGRLQFNINPVNSNDDYDWAVWDVTGDPQACSTKGNAIACNWTGARGATGLSLCPSQEPGYLGGDQFDNKTTNLTGAAAPITVQAGRVYTLLVDNFSTSNSGFTLLLGGACANPPLPVAQIGVLPEVNPLVECGTVLFANSNLSIGSTGYQYLWNFGDGTSSTQPVALHTYQGSPAGPTTYTATLLLTTPLGYQVPQAITVTVPALPDAQIVPATADAICAGDSLILRARGGTTFRWSPAVGLLNPTDSVIRVAPTANTTYQVVTEINGCADSTTYSVVVTPLPTTQVSAVALDLCAGSSTTLTATGAERYEWAPATGLSDSTSASVTATPATTTTYTVTGYNGNCGVTSTITLTVGPIPVATVVSQAPGVPICASDSTTLTARGGTTYQWSPAIGLSSTVDSVVRAAPPVSTTYQLIATRGQCSDTVTYRVEVTPQPVTQVVAVQPDLCLNSSTVLRATGAERYEWAPAPGLGTVFNDSVSVSPTVTTTYTVIGYNGSCGVPATVTVTVTPEQPATGTIAQQEGIVPFTTEFISTVEGATAWLWTFGDGQTSTEQNPAHTYSAAGTYPVTLTATYGPANCQTAVTEIGRVQVVEPVVYNVITPNGDGKNETFLAPVSNQPMKVQVFNRWGREVFSADNYQQNWNGGDLPAGTYYYHISVASGKTWKGWVEIVR